MNDPTIPCPECQGRPRGGCALCEGRGKVKVSEANRYVKGLRRDATALQTEAGDMLRRAKEFADRTAEAVREREARTVVASAPLSGFVRRAITAPETGF